MKKHIHDIVTGLVESEASRDSEQGRGAFRRDGGRAMAISSAVDRICTEVPGIWLIWSIEHGAWWASGENGYTESKLHAGHYSYIRALEIVEGANRHCGDTPNEAMVLYSFLDPKSKAYAHTSRA